MIAFDGVLHGLSHSGHGPLDFIWQQSKGERASKPVLFSAIGWHIVVDFFLGLLLFAIIAVLGRPGPPSAATIGVLVGGVVALNWGHVYSAFETSGKTILALAGLSLIQTILASFAVTAAYWGV
jgi:hypothetical protein